METTKFTDALEDLLADKSATVDERIDSAFALRKESAPEGTEADILLYRNLLDMIIPENGSHEYDLQMLQIYCLLAEAYVAAEDLRSLQDVAEGLLEMTGFDEISADVLIQTIPRIAEAIGESVYRHDLYEILESYLWTMFRHNPGVHAETVRPQVETYLRLRLLLGSDGFERRHMKDFKKWIAVFFTAAELTDIIFNPDTGYLRRDPVEYTRDWEEIYYDMIDEVEARLADVPRHMGFCFRYWDEEKRVLREIYGIDWNTPSQMNPGVMFD